MGGVQMKYHECMHLGVQQQFHAAVLLYMKVALRINVLYKYYDVFSNIFLKIVRCRKGAFFRLSLGLKMAAVC